MNGYQRVKAAISGKPLDYRPVMLHNFQVCAHENGLTMREFKHNPAKAAGCFIKNAEKYDLDGVFIDFDTATLAGAAGCKVRYSDGEPALATGTVLDEITDTGGLPAANLENDRGIMDWLECARLVSEYFGNEKYVRCNCDQAPFSLASMLRGAQQFMMDLLDEDAEEYVTSLLAYATRITSQFIGLAAQTGVHGLSNGDSVAGPSMISPTMYTTYAVSHENEIADYAHTLGKDYILHICGDTSSILDKMCEVRADVFELDYRTELTKIKEMFAGQKTVSGTIDPSSIISLGSPGDIRSAVNELLRVYKGSTRLIVCSGCALAKDVPEENMRTFVRTVREIRVS